MFLGELIFALSMAFLFTLIFAVRLQRRGPWASLWAISLVIFPAAWAGGLWISPAGPDIRWNILLAAHNPTGVCFRGITCGRWQAGKTSA
jgi:hypothetical protein